MKALVTGASSGIGRDMARYLSKMGYDLIIVARNKDGLEYLKEQLKTKVKIIDMDLSSEDNAKKLYELTKKDNVDVLINNAGFGVFGEFDKTDLDKELLMIDTNIKAVHILTKLFLQDMKKKNNGYILNVSSSAAFQPGPLMAAYYSTKVYVLHLTEAIYLELKKDNSNVHISCLCPGPVQTNFNNVAGVTFKVKPLTSEYVAEYAINQLFKNKLVIIPGLQMKVAKFMGRFASDKMKLNITYNIQRKKRG